jgi:FixJ family two-component response regulator
VVAVDDDPNVLKGLERLLTTHGYRVRLHQDPAEFLATGPPAGPACLLLDNQLQASMTGVQVHAEVVRRGWNLPTIFLTAHWSVQSVVTAVRAGADGYLTKPYEAAELLKAIKEALQRARATHRQNQHKAAALARAATLTKRERQIACLVLDGKMNKEIADELDLALVTVKVHRGRAMSKLGVANAAELASFARLAGLSD